MDSVVQAVKRHGLTTRERAGLGLHALAALALVPAYIVFSPAAHWHEPLLLAVLCALATIAIFHDVRLVRGVHFDATAALALIATALVGPLPALAVIYPPIAVNALCGRERLLRVGNLANLAAYGWYTLAGGLVLQAVSPDAGARLAGRGRRPPAADQLGARAGALRHALARPPAARARRDAARRAARRRRDGDARRASPSCSGATLGMLALALFALVAVIPQSALTYAARTRPVGLLDPLTAARRYGNAMAVHLGLSRTERRELDAVIRLAHERAVNGDPGQHLGHTVVDWSEVSCAAGHVTEWWNGAGGPAGLPGAIIPRSARIAAVARTWAALTAEGSPRLGHLDALAHLEGAAGVRLDPDVVRAARTVVAEERLSPAVPAPEPRLHHLRVPAPIRRALAAGG